MEFVQVSRFRIVSIQAKKIGRAGKSMLPLARSYFILDFCLVDANPEQCSSSPEASAMKDNRVYGRGIDIREGI